jgi:hypothetical protein
MNKDKVVEVVTGKVLPVLKSLGKTAVHAAVYSAVFNKVAGWLADRRKKNEESAK